MPGTTPPAYLAHWVVKTARVREMIEWYGHVFGAHVVHEGAKIAFLTWDEESHRLALIKLPPLMRFAFPLAKFRRKAYGLDHIAFGFDSLAGLLTKWEQLKEAGIEPVWAINHGPTTSLYYEDPDGIRLEFQVENFPTVQETAGFLSTQDFADNPIGVNIDPGYLLEQLRGGVRESELLHRGAGTRPGTRQKANRETINFRTL
ncbi:VOC family protein [Nocardia gamkensis]